MKDLPQPPSDRQWALLQRYQHCPPPMQPQHFLQQWNLDYPTLAQIVGVSRDTVSHWFSTGTSHRDPADHYCRRLATIDFLWRNHEQIPQDWLDRWCSLPPLDPALPVDPDPEAEP